MFFQLITTATKMALKNVWCQIKYIAIILKQYLNIWNHHSKTENVLWERKEPNDIISFCLVAMALCCCVMLRSSAISSLAIPHQSHIFSPTDCC